MPRRKLEERNDVQVIFRTSAEIKARIDAEADKRGLTTADWLRAVITAELDGVTPDEDLEKSIRKVVAEMVAEKEISLKKLSE